MTRLISLALPSLLLLVGCGGKTVASSAPPATHDGSVDDASTAPDGSVDASDPFDAPLEGTIALDAPAEATTHKLVRYWHKPWSGGCSTVDAIKGKSITFTPDCTAICEHTICSNEKLQGKGTLDPPTCQYWIAALTDPARVAWLQSDPCPNPYAQNIVELELQGEAPITANLGGCGEVPEYKVIWDLFLLIDTTYCPPDGGP